MVDTLICVDTDHDPDGSDGAPLFDGPRDEPVWALYEVLDDDGSEVWPVSFKAKGLTYQQAEDLALELGLTGRRIS